MKIKLLIVFAFILSGFQSLSSQLVSVSFTNCHDGDTCRTSTGERIRFACIDAPEINQPHGIASRDHLRSIVNRYNLAILKTDKDRFGRTIAEVYYKHGEQWKLLQKEQIRVGTAWANSRYRRTCPSWNIIESEFKKTQVARKGIFASNNPVPPWEWRKRN